MLTINNTLDGYLKDVEILGNTIQNEEDLADIRSVGDTVEGQELYEIPVVSVGKNLYKHTKNTQVVNGVTYTFNDDGTIQASGTAINYNAYLDIWVLSETNLPEGTYTFSGAEGVNHNGTYWGCPKTITISKNDKLTFYVTTGVGNANNKLYKPQIEEGTVATEYEPYVEDKITILSPVQLEKVGDVRDRIIEKDGVWGVEKNVGEQLFDSNSTWTQNSISENYIEFICQNIIPTNIVYGVGSSNFIVGTSQYSIRTSGSTGKVIIQYKISEAPTLDATEFTSYVANNPFIIKYVLAQPIFIPLPHDQQVKLRTFANKTNISFLTEIEGTIKAQVPKSLGATVNTHTTQISNLNKELDRVKKLEESTVSTVTTESDFTTVEATSNGYFEDVKLEGKTLIVNSEGIEVEAGTEGATLKSVGQDVDEIVVSSVNENLWNPIINNTYSNAGLNCNVNCINGVVSVTGKGTGSGEACSDYRFINIKLKPNTTYTFSYDSDADYGTVVGTDTVEVLIRDMKTLEWLQLKIPKTGATFTTKSSGLIGVRFDVNKDNATHSFYNIQIKEGNSADSYTPHQSDKKRLLYYNNETQTWEKPILREWDSIEKHSNGKYYYHQRSGEVVLNGSENWIIDNNNTRFGLYNIESITGNVNANIEQISDKFSVYDRYGEKTGSFGVGTGFVRIQNNFGFTTANEFKQWLQTNNVTAVYKLAQEKVYECTNIDLITYANETNYIVESGAIVPRTTLKVHNNISNVVSLLQKKVSLLESNMTNYMITQNRMQLASTYSADSVTFKVDYALCSEEVEYNEDLYNLILNNILVGKDNYNYDKMFTMVLDYASWNQISWEQFDILVGLMDIQHNPPIEEIPTDDEIVEEIPNEIM